MEVNFVWLLVWVWMFDIYYLFDVKGNFKVDFVICNE